MRLFGTGVPGGFRGKAPEDNLFPCIWKPQTARKLASHPPTPLATRQSSLVFFDVLRPYFIEEIENVVPIKPLSSYQDPTETSCEKCNSKVFGENRTHDPANLVRRSVNWATKAVAESVSWVLVYIWYCRWVCMRYIKNNIGIYSITYEGNQRSNRDLGVNRIHDLAILMRCCINNSLPLLACILISQNKSRLRQIYSVTYQLHVWCLLHSILPLVFLK